MLRQKNNRRGLRLAVWGLMLLLSGCKGPKPEMIKDGSKAGEGAVLTICIAESQWDESVDGLTQLYLKSHPEVESIQWTLVQRDTYWDLMNMKLATGTLPDIMEVRAGEELKQWYPHLSELDDEPVLDQIFPELLKNGMAQGHCYTVPQAIYGMGILYNTELLKEAGWKRLPETRTELEELCRDLEKAGIGQLMNPYHEISTWVEWGLTQMISMKDQPGLYVEHLKRSNQKPIREDNEWRALLDFTDLTLRYGNRRLLQLDTDLARNYFYIGRYAMIVGESARAMDGMRRAGQGVDECVRIGPIALSDDREKNRLLMDVVRLGVTKKARYPREAREFLTWIISDEEALKYQKQVMGIVPVVEAGCCEGLVPIAEETYRYYREGRMTGELTGFLPREMTDATGKEWARYIAGEIGRDKLLRIYEEYWRTYAERRKAENK